MTLPSSGNQISASQINAELNRSSSTQFELNDSEGRSLAGRTGSGSQISYSDFWGKSGVPPVTPGYVLFTSGSGNYNLPTTAGTRIGIMCMGGGGGGGGGSGRNTHTGRWSGGGGGASGQLRVALFDVPLNSTLSYTVGSGGAGGTARDGGFSTGSNGTQGGTSSVSRGGTSLVISAGGMPGSVSVSVTTAAQPPGTQFASGGGATSGGSFGSGAFSTQTSYKNGQDCYGIINNSTWSYLSGGAYPGTVYAPFYYVGGGYGAGGVTVNNSVGSSINYSHPDFGPSAYKFGNAFNYVSSDAEAGVSIGSQAVGATTASYSGYGYGGAGGGRDNEYYGTTGAAYLDGDAGGSGFVLIWWGY